MRIAPNDASGSAVSRTTVAESTLPLQRVYRWEKERAHELFLTQPWNGQVRNWTWAQAMDEVRRMAAYIRAQDWPAGSHIVILSKNCAWWIMAELAVWMSGHLTVPIYPSLTSLSVRLLLSHCDPVACFVGAVDDPTILQEGIPPEVRCIRFPNSPKSAAVSWETIIESTPPLAGSPVRLPDELATIIYTSGTTGAPKGVMHRFAAFSFFVTAVLRTVGEGKPERVLSYLPLAHIAERALVEAASFYVGNHLFFAESIDTFREDLRRARPTMFFSVPRLLLKFQHGVLAKMPQHRLSRLLRTPVVNTLVRRRILRELGLDHVRFAASGGAPLPVALLEWWRMLGLNLIEGYGMTETGITHTPPGGQSRPGYVGDSVPGVEAKISEDGELLVRSPMNMVGYYKDDDATRQAFTEDGFFRTGDLAEIDPNGWVRIIGRIKEQFKTSKGKYVSPAPIEHLLTTHPLVESCCVMGAGLSKAFALVVLTQEGAVDPHDPASRSDCEQQLTQLMEDVNSKLDAHERLHFLVVTDEPWTINNGFLTPTMKLRRAVIEKNYMKHFDEWDLKHTPVLWHISQPEYTGTGSEASA